MPFRRIAVLLLVPALALAAPKGGKKPPPKANPPVEPTKPEGSGSGAGSAAEPAPAEPAKEAPPQAAPQTPAPPQPAADEGNKKPAKEEADVDSLRQEYLALRDELFKSRARANAVASALYSTRVQIRLNWESGRYYGVSKASIRLDGATVFEDATGAIANDDGVRFDGYVAPGRHVVTFHVDATGKDDDSFTSSTETQVVVKAVASKDLVVAAHARDAGDIAYEWKKSEHGKYGLGIDVAVKTAAGAPKK